MIHSTKVSLNVIVCARYRPFNGSRASVTGTVRAEGDVSSHTFGAKNFGWQTMSLERILFVTMEKVV